MRGGQCMSGKNDHDHLILSAAASGCFIKLFTQMIMLTVASLIKPQGEYELKSDAGLAERITNHI